MCFLVKSCFLPLMEDRNTRMESTNLCVALWALVDLWSKKQTKFLAVPQARCSLTQPFICPLVPVPA